MKDNIGSPLRLLSRFILLNCIIRQNKEISRIKIENRCELFISTPSLPPPVGKIYNNKQEIVLIRNRKFWEAFGFGAHNFYFILWRFSIFSMNFNINKIENLSSPKHCSSRHVESYGGENKKKKINDVINVKMASISNWLNQKTRKKSRKWNNVEGDEA